MFYQASLLDMPSAISSPGSESGVTRSEVPDGQMIGPPGQDHAPVNLSARQAKEKGLLTSGTYGLHSTGSFASVDLMLSLASRLRAETACAGSTLFNLIWKQRRMPSGRSICALRASVRRTSDSGFSSWPTPRAEEAEHSGRVAIKDGQTFHLAAAANLSAWPSPISNDARSSDYATSEGRPILKLQGVAKLASWPTPQASDMTGGGQAKRADGRANLNDPAMLASWATPAARDFKSESATDEFNEKRWDHPRGKPLSAEVLLTDSGKTLNGSTVETESIGQLNPAFSLWLMGLPPEWLSCAELAMQSLRRSRKRLSARI